MVRSLCGLVGYAPGNGKKVTLDWNVDCEIYKKHQYIEWDVRKAKYRSASAIATLSKKRKDRGWTRSIKNSMASQNICIRDRFGGFKTYAVVNLHSLPNFSHWTHFGSAGSHFIFFSLQVVHAIARRLRGLPAFVTPHCALTSSPSMTFLQVVPSSYTQLGPCPGTSASPTTRAIGLTVFSAACGLCS